MKLLRKVNILENLLIEFKNAEFINRKINVINLMRVALSYITFPEIWKD